MQWILLVCFGVWIFASLTECYPAVQSVVSKPFQGSTSQAELVYPQLHFFGDPKTKSSDTLNLPVIVLRTSFETFYIELKSNDDLIKSNASKELYGNSIKNCHYHGNVLSHPDGVAAISICEYGSRMTGTIIVRKNAFILHPLDHLEDEGIPSHLQNISRSRGIDPHVISKVENPLTEYCGVEHNEIPMHLGDENDVDNHLRYRRSDPDSSKGVPDHKVIETSVFVDYPLYRKIVVEKRKPESELVDIVLAIINQVQIIYNYDSLKMKFKIVVVKLEILTEGKDVPDPAQGDIDVYLDNFCNWQNFINSPETDEKHWDHSIMLSGYDLYKLVDGQRNKKVLGLAWVNGMCRPKHSCTLNEGSSFEAAFVIAHEMGHSLGMLHDGHGNNCNSSGFLMAEKTGPGRSTWSKCSSDYLEKFFRKGRGRCLDDDDSDLPNGWIHKFDDQLPGYRFDLDAQCKLSLGEEYRPHIVSKIPFNNVCRELWCVSGLWASVAHPALEGSTCGNGGRCVQGNCRSKNQSLNADNDNSVDSMQKMIVDFMDKLKIAFQILLP